MALDSVRLWASPRPIVTGGACITAICHTRVPVNHLADFDDGRFLLGRVFEERHLGMPSAVWQAAFDHDGRLGLGHPVLDALGTHRRPAQEGGEPRVKFFLGRRTQVDFELRVVDDDVDVGRVGFAVVCALDMAATEIGYKSAGVRRVVLGLVDQAAGLVVDVAVRQAPGVWFAAAEGQQTLHLAARGAHEGLELLSVGRRDRRDPRVGRDIGGREDGRGGAVGGLLLLLLLLGQAAAAVGARGPGRGRLLGRGDGGDVADGSDNRLLEALVVALVAGDGADAVAAGAKDG